MTHQTTQSEFLATSVYCSAFLFIGFAAGMWCGNPTTVEVVKEVKVAGPERIVEVGRVAVDPAEEREIERLEKELEYVKVESAVNLDGWRKTYGLWKKLYDAKVAK